MNQVDKVMDRSLAKDKQVFGGVKSDSVFSHQEKHKGGNFSEVGGVLSDGSGLFKPKGENIVRKKAVKEHGSRKNGPQNERPGCDGLVPFKNLQTVHKGFKDFKVGFRKLDGKSLEPSKLKLASPSLPDVGFGSKEKSQEEQQPASTLLPIPKPTMLPETGGRMASPFLAIPPAEFPMAN
ncbi:hypothetical protein Q3G72_026009 [Acer saccharum]|nr:hypothetical protein Q3G72_026009 [Acer saccharum]